LDEVVTIVTVFRSRLRPGVDEAYGEVAEEMSRLVHAMDGFIDEKFYTSSDHERVTIVRFRDRESQRAWAELPEHVAAHRRGRDEFYLWYDISVSEERYQRGFANPQ
jgi:heme-degrading monooxygenase HmoA